jgi:ketosteroid isomerase-like protein
VALHGGNPLSKRLLQGLKEAWESGDADAVARLYADYALFEDGVGPQATVARGPKGVRAIVAEMFQPPGARFEVTSIMATKSGGVAEWRYSWPAKGTGRRNLLRGASVIIVRGNRVARESSYYDPEPELA